MHKSKHLYITGLTTGALSGLLSALVAYSMVVFVSAGGSLPLLAIIATLSGAGLGLLVSALVHFFTGRQ